MTIRVVHEDAAFLIVEKPEGIPTQPLPRGGGPSLADFLSKQFPEIKSVGGSDWGAVHRLDRETSGLVVFARKQKTYNALREAFSKNEVEKEYTALVERRVEEPGKIDWPIGPDPRSAKRVKVYRNIAEARRNKAQEAVTIYEPIAAGETSLLKIIIKTGRRHQIRAHLATMGHPIVGDVLYGGPEADRLHLHASRLRFQYPRDPKDPLAARWVEASSPAPFYGSSRSNR